MFIKIGNKSEFKKMINKQLIYSIFYCEWLECDILYKNESIEKFLKYNKSYSKYEK